MYACLFLWGPCKKKGVDSFVSLIWCKPRVVPLTLDPCQCDQTKLMVSGPVATKQKSPLFSSCGAEVMLSPLPSCAGHQKSHGVCLCVCVVEQAKLSNHPSLCWPALCFAVVTPSGEHLVAWTLQPDSTPCMLWWKPGRRWLGSGVS